ncbi:MAG: hypothetical protein ACYTEQ_14475 [Planctomycetota bacterium]|jgi:hypothetical protein
MPIVFHCEYCGKKIEAKDGAGGKWGKCPSCHNKLYVPAFDSDDELKLAPMDTSEEAKRRQLLAETYKITQDILQERDVPEGPEEPIMLAYEVSDEELTRSIITYLHQMAGGELGIARETANLIIPFGSRAVEILDRIALSDMPEPELADVPPQVLAGLIRDLRSQIGL